MSKQVARLPLEPWLGESSWLGIVGVHTIREREGLKGLDETGREPFRCFRQGDDRQEK